VARFKRLLHHAVIPAFRCSGSPQLHHPLALLWSNPAGEWHMGLQVDGPAMAKGIVNTASIHRPI
jgi:hypothetical protein